MTKTAEAASKAFSGVLETEIISVSFKLKRSFKSFFVVAKDEKGKKIIPNIKYFIFIILSHRLLY